MDMDLQETLKISIQKQYCYYCAVSFDNVSSFENHQCEERTHVVNGDSTTNINNSDLNEARLDDLGINEQDLRPDEILTKPEVDPLWSNHIIPSEPKPGFLVNSTSRKRKSPIQLQRKELKVKRRKKKRPLKCPHRGCNLMFPADDLLLLHLKISHKQKQQKSIALTSTTTTTTAISSSSSSSTSQIDQESNSSSSSSSILTSSYRSLSEIEKIDVHCRTCKLDFSSAQSFFDHLFLPPHTQKSTLQPKSKEKEREIPVKGKKENINVCESEVLSVDFNPKPSQPQVSPSALNLNEKNNSDNNSIHGSGHNVYDDDDDDGMDSFFEPKNHSEFTTNNNSSSNNNNGSDSNFGINLPQPPVIFNDDYYENKERKKKKKFTHSRSKSKSSKSKSTNDSKSKEKLPRGPKPKLKTCSHPECKGLTFLTTSNLISHRRRVHPIPQEEKRKFKCPYDNCGRVCTENSNLKAHIRRVHEGHRDFLCNVCAKTFFDDISLRQHQLIHGEGEKKFKCKVCTKSFRHRATLSRHVSIHTGEQNYLCVTCGRSFRTPDAHRVHLRIHADVRMFPCPVCPAAHNHKATLQKHLASKHPEWEGTL